MTSKPIHSSIWALLVVGLASAALIWAMTAPSGIGYYPDSKSYLSLAGNIKDELAYKDLTGQYSTHYPPLYPALIASTAYALQTDTLKVAPRIVAALTFGLVGALTFCAMSRAYQSAGLIALGILGMLAQFVFITFGALAMSETTCLVFILAGGLCFAAWRQKPRLSLLILCGVFFGLASITRYAAVIFAVASVPFILFYPDREKIIKRLFNCALLGAVSYAPLFAWFAGWRILGQSGGARSISWHPIPTEKLQSAFRTLGSTIYTGSQILGVLVILTLLAVFCWEVYRIFKTKGADGEQARAARFQHFIPAYVSGLSLAYMAFIAFSLTFLDHATLLSYRILSPVIWATVFLMVFYVAKLLPLDKRKGRIALALVFLIFGGRFVTNAMPFYMDRWQDGMGIIKVSLDNEEIEKRMLASRDDGRTIYTNRTELLFFGLGLQSKHLPGSVIYTTGKTNPYYDESMQRIFDEVRNSEAIIFLDSTYSDPYYVPATAEECNAANLPQWSYSPDDKYVIYGNVEDAQVIKLPKQSHP